jgi:hypothetical protein
MTAWGDRAMAAMRAARMSDSCARAFAYALDLIDRSAA